MIDFVKGNVVHWESEYVVVDVHDVGYRVFAPQPAAIAASEQPVTLYTHHHVREDATLLYGFSTRDEQRLFRKLLDVSGIGPRVALGVLAAGTPAALIGAIHSENLAYLTKLPGIGRKTAQRMILDLKDKLDVMQGLQQGGTTLQTYAGLQIEATAGGVNWQEAREALAALGYSTAELDRAWQALVSDAQAGAESEGAKASMGAEVTLGTEEPVEVLMKRALRHLYKG